MVRFRDDTDGTYERFPSNRCAYLYHPYISDKEEGDRYFVRADNPTDDQELDLTANRRLWKIESRDGYRLLKHVDTDKYLHIHPVSYEVGDHNGGSCEPDRHSRLHAHGKEKRRYVTSFRFVFPVGQCKNPVISTCPSSSQDWLVLIKLTYLV
eukprot:scaffold520_cov300-Pavlova_lutheri.AAC.3